MSAPEEAPLGQLWDVTASNGLLVATGPDGARTAPFHPMSVPTTGACGRPLQPPNPRSSVRVVDWTGRIGPHDL